MKYLVKLEEDTSLIEVSEGEFAIAANELQVSRKDSPWVVSYFTYEPETDQFLVLEKVEPSAGMAPFKSQRAILNPDQYVPV